MRLLRTGFVVLLIACATLAAHAARKNPVLPDWVMQAAAAKVEIPAGAHPKAAVLLSDTLLTVGADGFITERYREVDKILRPQGRTDAQPLAWFNKDHKLISFHIWSIGPDGHHYIIAKNQMTEMGAQEWGILYNDVRYETANVPGSDPGGIVASEFVMRFPLYSGDEPWQFQNTDPTVKSVFEVDLPPGWHISALWHHYASVKPVEVAPNHYRWELDNIPGINLDSVQMAPAEDALAGRMEAYFSANALPSGTQEAPELWAHIGEWYTQLAAPQSEGAADIVTASRALISSQNGSQVNFLARIRAVANFMQQQIRYVGIEIGIGGMIPHAAEEVYRNRYGDCKDKATLMISMLDTVGVRATWVLVDTDRGFVDPNAPSRLADHMIVAILLQANAENPALQSVVTTRNGQRWLIFDPTNQYVPIGLLPTYLQGGTGLLMDGAASQAIALPVLAPASNTVQRTANFTLAPDGTLSGEVTVEQLGPSSDDARRSLAMSSTRSLLKDTEQALGSDFSSFTVTQDSAANIQSLDQPVALRYSVTASDYARHAGNLLLVRPRVIGSDAVALTQPTRKFPIAFDATGTWSDNFSIKLPPGYTALALPDPVNVTTDFAGYQSKVTDTGGVLRYTRRYTVKKLDIGANQYAGLQKFESAISADESRDAVFQKSE